MTDRGVLSVANCTFTDNRAIGGTGNAGGPFAGQGVAGAVLHERGSTATVTSNTASGGTAGSGGATGLGEGGGLYLADGGVACLDTFTQAHTTNNHATTDHDNIFGSFTTC